MFENMGKRILGLRDSIADKGMSAMSSELAFQSALMNGRTDIVRHHLDNGRDVNAKAGEYPPLYLAIMSGHTQTALLLLERNAAPNAQNHGGETALHIATVKKNLPVVTALLKAGIDTSIRNNRRETALELAFVMQAHDIMAAMIVAGADINQRMSNNCRISDYASVLPKIRAAMEEGAARKHTARLKHIHMKHVHMKRRNMRGPS